jgi:hypothetical protein
MNSVIYYFGMPPLHLSSISAVSASYLYWNIIDEQIRLRPKRAQPRQIGKSPLAYG